VLGDEATGAVDSETAQQLAGIMQHLNRQHQVTFVLVTHDLDLAAETDRVIGLKDGKVIADETTAPASVAV